MSSLSSIFQHFTPSLGQHFIKLARVKDYRMETGRILIGGIKIVNEYVDNYGEKDLLSLICTPKFRSTKQGGPELIERILKLLLQDGKSKINKCYSISEYELEKVTREGRSEGIICEVRRPSLQTSIPSLEWKRVLVLWSIGDPSNMGALIRTAIGLGWKVVVTGSGSCDPFSFSAIRCSKGASLYSDHIAYIQSPLELINNELRDYSIITTVNSQQSSKQSIGKEMSYDKIALIIGNESHGLEGFPLESLSTARNIWLPLSSNHVKSLNVAVAAGILMSQLAH